MIKRSQRMLRTQPVALIPSASFLPLFDGVFAVAVTLLAFALPDHAMSSMDVERLGLAVAIYTLTGASVLLFWFKLRRLITVARRLLITQSAIAFSGMLLIVLMPKLMQLVVIYGRGDGDFTNWTPSQIVNTTLLASFLLMDLLCFLFSRSLLASPYVSRINLKFVARSCATQPVGCLLILVLFAIQQVVPWFDNEYVLLVPVILLTEEWLLVARSGIH
jgi:uncharacterized membrane protein